MRIIQKLIKTVYNDFSDEEYNDGPSGTPSISPVWFVLDVHQLDSNKMLK